MKTSVFLYFFFKFNPPRITVLLRKLIGKYGQEFTQNIHKEWHASHNTFYGRFFIPSYRIVLN